jgi:putative flippase GtrA
MTSIRDLVLQGLRFGMVGLWATAVYVVAALLAHRAGASSSLANVLAYAIGTVVSFLGHFYWTFRKSTGHGRALLRFLVVSGCGFLLSAVIMHLVAETLRAPFWLALTAIIAVVPFVSWLLGRYWAFR